MQAKDLRKYITCIDACMLNHLHADNQTNSETRSTHVVSQATTGCATKHMDSVNKKFSYHNNKNQVLPKYIKIKAK
jgi:hypothetical protein